MLQTTEAVVNGLYRFFDHTAGGESGTGALSGSKQRVCAAFCPLLSSLVAPSPCEFGLRPNHAAVTIVPGVAVAAAT
jgi:hypothetical protein